MEDIPMRPVRSLPASLLLALIILIGNSGLQSSPADSLLNYFPLHIGDTWQYYYEEALPDTFLTQSSVINDTIRLGDKLYFNYVEPRGMSVLYRSENDRVYRWVDDIEILWFDFTVAIGDTYTIDLPGIWKPYVVMFSKNEIVRTRAGVFTDCYLLLFDDPHAVDDAEEYWFAPNIGIVKMMWPHAIRPTLYAARVDGREYPGPTLNVGKEIHSELPKDFSFEAVYPQPFSSNTTIEFTMRSHSEDVEVAIYNLLGQKLATLEYSRYDTAKYHANWNGRNSRSEQKHHVQTNLPDLPQLC